MNLAPIFMLQVFSPTLLKQSLYNPEHKKDVEIKLEKAKTIMLVEFRPKIIRFPHLMI